MMRGGLRLAAAAFLFAAFACTGGPSGSDAPPAGGKADETGAIAEELEAITADFGELGIRLVGWEFPILGIQGEGQAQDFPFGHVEPRSVIEFLRRAHAAFEQLDCILGDEDLAHYVSTLQFWNDQFQWVESVDKMIVIGMPYLELLPEPPSVAHHIPHAAEGACAEDDWSEEALGDQTIARMILHEAAHSYFFGCSDHDSGRLCPAEEEFALRANYCADSASCADAAPPYPKDGPTCYARDNETVPVAPWYEDLAETFSCLALEACRRRDGSSSVTEGRRRWMEDNFPRALTGACRNSR